MDEVKLAPRCRDSQLLRTVVLIIVLLEITRYAPIYLAVGSNPETWSSFVFPFLAYDKLKGTKAKQLQLGDSTHS